MNDLRNDKPLFGITEVLMLSWPASLNMLNRTLMQFVDGLMVSSLGPGPFSAQLVGGMTAFVPESFAMGCLLVVNTYVSQNLGAGRFNRCGQYTWAGLTLAFAFCCIIAPMALLAGPVFGLFGHAHQALEVMYFRYMIIGVFLTLPARVIEQFFYGIHRPGIVLGVSLLANVVNVAANYVLIYGKFGFPALGLKGAAIGTVISWTVLLALLLAAFLRRRFHERFATRSFRAVTMRYCLDLLKIGYPAGVQFVNDILPWTLFMAALVGRFGTGHLAASSAVMRYMSLSFMPAIGIGIATTALVGKYIGAGRPDLARRRTHAALLVGMTYMGLCGLAFWIFRYPMIELFVKVLPSAELTAAAAQARAADIVETASVIMLCAAVFQLFDAVGIVYVGALRGAGDTHWPMIVTVVLSWGLLVCGGAAAVYLLPQLKSIGPWLAASVYVMAVGLMMALRFESGAWRKINLLGRPAKVEPCAEKCAEKCIEKSSGADDEQ